MTAVAERPRTKPAKRLGPLEDQSQAGAGWDCGASRSALRGRHADCDICLELDRCHSSRDWFAATATSRRRIEYVAVLRDRTRSADSCLLVQWAERLGHIGDLEQFLRARLVPKMLGSPAERSCGSAGWRADTAARDHAPRHRRRLQRRRPVGSAHLSLRVVWQACWPARPCGRAGCASASPAAAISGQSGHRASGQTTTSWRCAPRPEARFFRRR